MARPKKPRTAQEIGPGVVFDNAHQHVCWSSDECQLVYEKYLTSRKFLIYGMAIAFSISICAGILLRLIHIL